MQITAFSDYALRILMYLAVSGDRLVSTREIAGRHGLSFDHSAKVARFLAREGYVEAVRGRGGGLRLARVPQDISIGAVLRRAEAGSGLVECLRGAPVTCVLAPVCGLTRIFVEANEAFFGALDRRSLADALPRTGDARRVLGLVADGAT